jgi:predicted nucleic acid-binding protein
MKVFLDTNVLVAAYEWPDDTCADVYERVLREHDLALSGVVIAESRRVLKETFRVPPELLAVFVDELKAYQETDHPDNSYDISFDDEDDLYVLQSAVAVGADILVTGDKPFRALDEDVPELSIRTPREFLDMESD